MRALQLVAIGALLKERSPTRPEAGQGQLVVDVAAAGICHSDVHYRDGLGTVGPLPLTLGHEIAGTVAEVGEGVDSNRLGSRVGVHYVVSCGSCDRCRRRGEQFCETYAMIGKDRDGGYAEAIAVPDRNAVELPAALDMRHAAVMMCSSVTALHSLHRAAMRPGDVVAVFGVGGLGLSAVQIAAALGAGAVLAVDRDGDRLSRAEALGATAVEAGAAGRAIVEAGGADVALDLVGSGTLLRTALDSMAPGGRVVSVGLTGDTVGLHPLPDLIARETTVIGSNDHTIDEVHEVLTMAETGRLRLDTVVTDEVPLQAAAVNLAMDDLSRYGSGGRRVIVPG
jgi:propanol-preferring alcohol dehydrogenase